MFCSKCGAENRNHYKFCIKCGEQLQASSEFHQQSEKQKQKIPGGNYKKVCEAFPETLYELMEIELVFPSGCLIKNYIDKKIAELSTEISDISDVMVLRRMSAGEELEECREYLNEVLWNVNNTIKEIEEHLFLPKSDKAAALSEDYRKLLSQKMYTLEQEFRAIDAASDEARRRLREKPRSHWRGYGLGGFAAASFLNIGSSVAGGMANAGGNASIKMENRIDKRDRIGPLTDSVLTDSKPVLESIKALFSEEVRQYYPEIYWEIDYQKEMELYKLLVSDHNNAEAACHLLLTNPFNIENYITVIETCENADAFVNEQMAHDFNLDLHLRLQEYLKELLKRNVIGIKNAELVNRTTMVAFYDNRDAKVRYETKFYCRLLKEAEAAGAVQLENTVKFLCGLAEEEPEIKSCFSNYFENKLSNLTLVNTFGKNSRIQQTMEVLLIEKNLAVEEWLAKIVFNVMKYVEDDAVVLELLKEIACGESIYSVEYLSEIYERMGKRIKKNAPETEIAELSKLSELNFGDVIKKLQELLQMIDEKPYIWS